ncbi:MAG: AAA family ATPase, partial [Rhodospirillaceae bacterium]|nr:AAA family ATPase [Rhodospirillaceae bacterium]
MLVSLHIRDLAVIERVDLDFGSGLTVLTGETGAGKSILLDALGLATGRRADAALVRPGAERASVAATFTVPDDHHVRNVLAERGVDAEGDIIVRRQVQADGRSKAFINDEPVGVALLAELGEALVEVHGQHDQRGLLRPEMHRSILDTFGGHQKIRRNVSDAFGAWREAKRLLDQMQADESTLQERRETLIHDVGELDQLAPEAGEDENLAASRSRLANAQKIGEALSAGVEALEGDDGIDSRLRRAAGELGRIREVAGGALDETLGALDRALLETNEALEGMAAVGRELDADGSQLEKVEERLFALRAVARRHQVPVDLLADVLARLTSELAALED